MAWRTSTAGHAARCIVDRADGILAHGTRIETYDEEEDGSIRPLDRASKPRYCPECGKKVCAYKDPNMKKNVYCYAHDYLTEWTRHYIVGKAHVHRSYRGIIGEGERGTGE